MIKKIAAYIIGFALVLIPAVGVAVVPSDPANLVISDYETSALTLAATGLPANAAVSFTLAQQSGTPVVNQVNTDGNGSASSFFSGLAIGQSYHASVTYTSNILASLDFTTLNMTALSGTINSARIAFSSATEGTSPGNYPAGSKAKLQAEILNAATMITNTTLNVTQAQVDSEVTTLSSVLSAFNQSQIPSPGSALPSGTTAATGTPCDPDAPNCSGPNNTTVGGNPTFTSTQPAALPNTPATTTPSTLAIPSSTSLFSGSLIVPNCNRGTSVNSTNTGLGTACDFNALIQLINNLIKFLLFTIATPLVALIICYVGFLMLTSGGSSEKVTKAKHILLNVVIGYIIGLAAWLIVSTILKIVGFSGNSFLTKY